MKHHRNPKSLLIYSVALFAVGCTDSLLLDDKETLPPDDGTVRFIVSDNFEEVSTRSASVDSLPADEWAINLKGTEGSLSGLGIEVAEFTSSAPVSGPATRVWTSSNTFDSFSVSALLEDGRPYFSDPEVKKEGAVWTTGEDHYWPEEKLDFYAYTPCEGLAMGEIGESEMFFKITPRAEDDGHDAENHVDLMLAYNSRAKSDEVVESNNGCVDLQFNHALAGLCFVSDEADDSFTVNKITVKGIYGTGNGEYVPTNVAASSKFIWSYEGKQTARYSQEVREGENGTGCEVVIGSGTSQRKVNALAAPFLVVPQRNMDNAEVEINVTNSEGETYNLTASLSALERIRAGRMYVLTVSRRNALYPPVENLDAAVGKDLIFGGIELSWDNPAEYYLPDVYIYRLYIISGDGEEKYRVVDPKNRKIVDGVGYVSQPSTVTYASEDIHMAREFEYTVYVDYINKQDYEEGNLSTLHRSIGRHVSISTVVKTDVPCAFYMPRAMDTTNPVEELPDDDDKEAANWYRRNVARGRFVNNLSLDALDVNRYPVLWIPSGVAIHNNWNGKSNGDYNFGRTAEEAQVRNIREYFGDDGIRNYFNDEDIAAIRRYYERGGNLLLTNFSVALVKELGVVPGQETDNWRYMPNIRYYNELKDPMVWFLRGTFEGHNYDKHPLYRDVTKVDPQALKDYWWDEQREDIQVDGSSGVPMFPLLSGSAGQCENNNVVWDFTDGKMGMSMDDFERECQMRFIGTWGQVSNKNVGTVAEFYPRTETRNGQNVRLGRVIAIGLGAFEFSNGLFYDYWFVQNRYQTNVQQITANALEYLQSKD